MRDQHLQRGWPETLIGRGGETLSAQRRRQRQRRRRWWRWR